MSTHYQNRSPSKEIKKPSNGKDTEGDVPMNNDRVVVTGSPPSSIHPRDHSSKHLRSSLPLSPPSWCQSIGMIYNPNLSKNNDVLGIPCEDFVGLNNKFSRDKVLESVSADYVNQIDYHCCAHHLPPAQEPSQHPFPVYSYCEDEFCFESSVTPTISVSGIPSGHPERCSEEDLMTTTTIIVSGDTDEETSNVSPEILIMASAVLLFTFFSFKCLKKVCQKLFSNNKDQGRDNVVSDPTRQFDHDSEVIDEEHFSQFEHIDIPLQQHHNAESEFKHIPPWLP